MRGAPVLGREAPSFREEKDGRKSRSFVFQEKKGGNREETPGGQGERKEPGKRPRRAGGTEGTGEEAPAGRGNGRNRGKGPGGQGERKEPGKRPRRAGETEGTGEETPGGQGERREPGKRPRRAGGTEGTGEEAPAGRGNGSGWARPPRFPSPAAPGPVFPKKGRKPSVLWNPFRGAAPGRGRYSSMRSGSP